jgi:hypothetical protein
MFLVRTLVPVARTSGCDTRTVYFHHSSITTSTWAYIDLTTLDDDEVSL